MDDAYAREPGEVRSGTAVAHATPQRRRRCLPNSPCPDAARLCDTACGVQVLAHFSVDASTGLTEQQVLEVRALARGKRAPGEVSQCTASPGELLRRRCWVLSVMPPP